MLEAILFLLVYIILAETFSGFYAPNLAPPGDARRDEE